MQPQKTILKILKGYSSERSNLLPVIKEINYQVGFFSLEAVFLVSKHFGLSASQVFEVASFYDEIKVKKPCLVEVGICDSLNCVNKATEKIIQSLESFFHIKEGDDINKKLKVKRISCQGRCLSGPIMIVNGHVYEKVTPGFAVEIVKDYLGIKI